MINLVKKSNETVPFMKSNQINETLHNSEKSNEIKNNKSYQNIKISS